jgi:hypothetical protein
MAVHWNRLIESLGTWADPREVTGGVEVTFRRPSGGHRTVELVLTPDQWDSLVGLLGRESPSSVKERILELPEDRPFLVCDHGVDLVPSATRAVPPALAHRGPTAGQSRFS